MKTKLLSCLALAIILITTFGCQNPNAPSTDEKGTTSALKKIEAYNSTLINTVHTRGYSRIDFLKAICIAAADIGGIAAGISAVKEIAFVLSIPTGGIGAAVTCGFAGLICSVGASYAAHSTCYPQTRTDSSEFIDPQTILDAILISNPNFERDTTLHILPSIANRIRLPENFEHVRDFGIRHNEALVTLEEIRSGEIDIQDLDLDPELETIVTSNDFNTAYDVIINAATNATTTENFSTTEFLNITSSYLSGQEARVLELFFEVYTLYPEDQQDIAELINNYIAIIEDSDEFTYEEKEIIYASLMIAAESPLHWQEIIN